MKKLLELAKTSEDTWDAALLLRSLDELLHLSDQRAQGLTEVATVSAYDVGAGEEVKTAVAVELPAFKTDEIKKTPTGYVEGVGRECEGTPRREKKKGANFKKNLSDTLAPHRSEIELFWEEKHSQSPRSERSWNFLCKQLERVLSQHGPLILTELLEEATAQRWKTIKPSYHQAPRGVTISERQQGHQSEAPKGGCYEVFSGAPVFE